MRKANVSQCDCVHGFLVNDLGGITPWSLISRDRLDSVLRWPGGVGTGMTHFIGVPCAGRNRRKIPNLIRVGNRHQTNPVRVVGQSTPPQVVMAHASGTSKPLFNRVTCRLRTPGGMA